MICSMHRTRAGGFTLIELLVVVAIIGLIASIAIPVYLRFLDRNRNAALAADLKAIHTALVRYNADYGTFPPDTGGSAFDPVTMNPLASQGYFKNVQTFLNKLNGDAIDVYTTWDFRGPNSDVMIRAQTKHDPDLLVYSLDYISPGGTHYDGVYFWKGGQLWTADEINEID